MSSGLSASTFVWLALLLAPTFIFFEAESHCGAQAGLILGGILFLWLPKC